jgi:predicted phosphodiesterase
VKQGPTLVLAAVLSGAPCLALELTRGPYLGRPDDVSVSVSWTTDVPATSRVDYTGPDGVLGSVADAEAVQKHLVRLGPLSSGALYCYRVFSDEVELGERACFRAPRGPTEQAFRFAVIGDTDGGTVPSRIAARLVLDQPDLAIHMGDVVYPDGAEGSYDSQFFGPFKPWLQRGPVLPAIGNHDARTERAAPLLADFVVPKNGVTEQSRFYSFRQGNVLFVCLDDETSAYGEGSPQFDWLVATLSASDSLWKVVYFHEPPYSSDHSNLVERLMLCPVFERFGVDVVFSGHAHLYERTHPIRLFADSGPGVLYVTEGGGGASLSTIHRIPESAYVSASFGYVLADVDGRTLSITAHDVEGNVFDSVVLEKADDPGPARVAPVRARERSPRAISREPH